jgi:hypothetical protein
MAMTRHALQSALGLVFKAQTDRAFQLRECARLDRFDPTCAAPQFIRYSRRGFNVTDQLIGKWASLGCAVSALGYTKE